MNDHTDWIYTREENLDDADVDWTEGMPDFSSSNLYQSRGRIEKRMVKVRNWIWGIIPWGWNEVEREVIVWSTPEKIQ